MSNETRTAPRDAARARVTAMTPWRLEVLRMVRTRRMVLLVGAGDFFGVTGPLLARYLADLVAGLGDGELTIITAAPRPVDGIMQFVSNAGQLGLLAVVVVSAGALKLDAQPEFAAFLRTKVAHTRTLLLPRYVLATVTSIVALVVGTRLAWSLTLRLLGGKPAGPLGLGTVLGARYLAFAVAVVEAAASRFDSIVGTVFANSVVLVALPLVGLVPSISPWLPSELLAAIGG